MTGVHFVFALCVYFLSLCPHKLGRSCSCCRHFNWVMHTAGPSHVDFNCHLKYLQKDYAMIWFGLEMESFCERRKASRQTWGGEWVLEKLILVFGEWLQYLIFLQRNYQIFPKPLKRKPKSFLRLYCILSLRYVQKDSFYIPPKGNRNCQITPNRWRKFQTRNFVTN